VKTKLQELKERNDELSAKLAMNERTELVKESLGKLPKELRNDWLVDFLFRMDKEDVKPLCDYIAQVHESTRGRVTGMGDEFTAYESKEEASEGEKSEVVDAARRDKPTLKRVK
jgi:hypothetical protein